MKNYPKVFIVILNYNGKDVIKKCLSSVFKINYPNFEVVIVDNNSTDESFEIAKSNFSKANFIRNEENLGFASGNNIGIRFALERMAEYVLILNNDTEVEPDFLEKLIEVGEKEEKAGILGPVIFNGGNKQVWFSKGIISWMTMKSEHSQKIETKDYYESDYITGCAMLVKANVFKEIGLFDEDFFLYWEDADFSLRARRTGFKNLVVTASWVYHYEKSEKSIKNKVYWLVMSGLIFFKKNTPVFLKPWVNFYLFMRKVKNITKIVCKRSEIALIVRKAYKDFENAKF